VITTGERKIWDSRSDAKLDWRRVSQVALCVLVLFFFIGVREGQSKSHREVVPAKLQKAIGCLVAADYIRDSGLKPIGLRVGDFAWVRYEIAPIAGMWRTPGWNIAVYSQNGRRGTLLFVDPNHRGGFQAIRNGYNLAEQGSRWTADGGQGGVHDYEAIGRYVTRLSRRPRYRVRLLPGGPDCTQEQQ
jgi:hypothetical protein